MQHIRNMEIESSILTPILPMVLMVCIVLCRKKQLEVKGIHLISREKGRLYSWVVVLKKKTLDSTKEFLVK